jgi:hypothetical protein
MATQTKVAAKSWGLFVDGKWLNEGEPGFPQCARLSREIVPRF